MPGRGGQPGCLQRAPGPRQPGERELVAGGRDGPDDAVVVEPVRDTRTFGTGGRSGARPRPSTRRARALSASSSSLRRSGCESEWEPSSIPAASSSRASLRRGGALLSVELLMRAAEEPRADVERCAHAKPLRRGGAAPSASSGTRRRRSRPPCGAPAAPRRAAPPPSGSGSRGAGGSGGGTREVRGEVSRRAGSSASVAGNAVIDEDAGGRAGGRSSEGAADTPAEPPRGASGREAHQLLVAVVALQPQADHRRRGSPRPAGAGCADRSRSRARWPSTRPGNPRPGRLAPFPRSPGHTGTRPPRRAPPARLRAARLLPASSSSAASYESVLRSGWETVWAPISTPVARSSPSSASVMILVHGTDRCGRPSHPETTKTVAVAPSSSSSGASVSALSTRPSSKVSAAWPAASDADTSRASSPKETSR